MWIKICGVRDLPAARAAAAAGADAVGLNFFAGSTRVVDRATAAEIAGGLPASVVPTGVFVNHAAGEIVETVRECGLRAVQLHGDEPPEMLADLRGALPGIWIIRAWRLGRDGLDPLGRLLEELRLLGAEPDACLVDARVDGRYGGTGRTAPWDLLSGGWPAGWPRLILAGGLTPENVGAGIRTARPWGVDVAGGVEAAPGVKDAALLRRFVEAARTA